MPTPQSRTSTKKPGRPSPVKAATHNRRPDQNLASSNALAAPSTADTQQPRDTARRLEALLDEHEQRRTLARARLDLRPNQDLSSICRPKGMPTKRFDVLLQEAHDATKAFAACLALQFGFILAPFVVPADGGDEPASRVSRSGARGSTKPKKTNSKKVALPTHI